MKDFSDKLKKRLKERGMTQGELCERMTKMTPAGLINMIKEDSIKVRVLEEICAILEVPMDYFIEVESKPTGAWQKAIDTAYDDLKKTRLMLFQYQEKFGVLNFNWLSKSVRPFFCLQY